MGSLYESGYTLDQLFSIPQHVYNPQTYRFEPKGNKSAANLLTEILAYIKENNIENAVISCTYASLKSLYKNYRELLDQLNALLGDYVSDEAHNTTGSLGSEMKEYFMERDKGNPSGKIHQLMTATPDRARHSLRDVHHTMINIKLQECFEDGTLVRPGFRGVGNSYLPTAERTRLPSNMQLETSGKYIDENGRPIREVVADRYVEEKEKFPYCPAMFFCGSIKEATDMQTYFNKTHPHIRTIRATSIDTITLGEIEDMIYADEVDVVLTVTRLAV